MQLQPIQGSQDYYTDGKNIFFQHNNQKAQAIPNVDVETFKIHSYYLASDKNQVYALSTMKEGLQVFIPEDMESVIFFPEAISAAYFVDRYNFYQYNEHFIQYYNINDRTGKIIEVIQWLVKHFPNSDGWWDRSETFFDTLSVLSHEVYTDGEDVFYQYRENQEYDYPNFDIRFSKFYLQLKGAQCKDVQVLNDVYSKTSENVYFYSKVIAADADSFTVIEGMFAKDKAGIWFNGRLVEDVDAETFAVLTDKTTSFQFARDKYSLFAAQHSQRIGKYQGYGTILRPISGGDADSFVPISDVWAKDKNNVYWYGKVYKKADATTFEKISDRSETEFDYARDKNYVYIDNGQTLKKGLDGASFTILNQFWAKDNYVVYSLSNHKIIKGIDVNSFSVLDDHGKAEDDQFYYEYKGYTVKKTKKA